MNISSSYSVSRKVYFLILCVTLLLPLLLAGSLPPQPGKKQPQSKAQAQLQTAVSSGSEIELQKVEQAFPRTRQAALARFLRGYLRLQAKDYVNATALLGDEMIGRYSDLGDYAFYYQAQALKDAGRNDEAEKAYRQLEQNHPSSLLARSAALQAAGSAMQRSAYEIAVRDLARLADKEHDGAALKLKADALEKLGRNDELIATLRTLYFAAPQSDEADAVPARLSALGSSTAPTSAEVLRMRADRLYAAERYDAAAQAYSQMASQFATKVTSEDRMRGAISYYQAKSWQQALDAFNQMRARTPQDMADVIWYRGMSYLALGQETNALQALADLRRTSPESERIGSLLYEIGRYYERRKQATQAQAFYEQLITHVPRYEKADEIQFELAWNAHQAKDWAKSGKLLLEHIALFGDVTDNRGQASFWAARDLHRAGEKAKALTVYKALLTRYTAGWYGYISEKYIAELERAGVRAVPQGKDETLDQAVAKLQPNPPVVETIKRDGEERVGKSAELSLIALHSLALNEAEAAREKYPTSQKVNLRIAQIYRARNENAAAINALRRGYPDYAQALPEEMTRDVWDIFYPLGWWDTIKQEAKRRNLDPYQVAGLIRQESIFNPQARSRANALGLMQLLPSTGRLVARRYGVGDGSVSNADLYNPVLNIQLGTAYLEQLIGRFGRFEYVAAAYNGGPTRVSRWINQLPGETIEDWVESIPISETRFYVQGVYRNMRQYQRLYDNQGNFLSIVPE